MATINPATSDPEALAEIGSRLRLYRVNQELTAEELARTYPSGNVPDDTGRESSRRPGTD